MDEGSVSCHLLSVLAASRDGVEEYLGLEKSVFCQVRYVCVCMRVCIHACMGVCETVRIKLNGKPVPNNPRLLPCDDI